MPKPKSKSLYQRKTLRERVSEIMDFATRDKQFMNEIAVRAGIDRSNILKYLNGKQNMRLPNIGKLLHETHIYLKDKIGDKNHNIFKQLDFNNISEDLTKIEYERLGVYAAKHLCDVMSSDLDTSYRLLPPLNIDSYIDDMINGWEDSATSKLYIPLTAKSQNEQDLKVDIFLNKWISKKDENLLFLFGDLGTGKTTTLEHFAQEMAKKYKSNEIKRIPVFLPLVSFQKDKTDIINVLSAYFVEDLKISLINGYKDIELLNKNGRLLFILDGFDEMSKMNSNNIIVRNVQELSKIVCPECKIILSTRSHFFKDHKDFIDKFADSELGKLFDTKNKLTLNTYTQKDIEIYIEKFCKLNQQKNKEISNKDELLDRINQLPETQDLCQHPLMLDIILKVLPDITEKSEINRKMLFKKYSEKWLERKDDYYVMKPKQRRIFSEELAWYLWTNKQRSVHHDKFESLISEKYTALQENMNSEHYEYEFRNSTFLVRDDNGNYFFMHDAFLYYFTAHAFLKRIELFYQNYSTPNENVNTDELKNMGNAVLSEDEIDFIVDMDINTKALYTLSDYLKEEGKNYYNTLIDNINSISKRLGGGNQYSEFIKKVKDNSDFHSDKELQHMARVSMQKLHQLEMITLTQILQTFLEECLQRNDYSNACSIEQLLILFDNIALYCFLNGMDTIIPEQISDILINSKDDSLKEISYNNDIKNLLMTVDFFEHSDNNFSFSHEKIKNFLVAHNLIRQIEKGYLIDISKKVLNHEIINHLKYLNISQDNLLESFDQFKNNSDKENTGKYLGTNILMLMIQIGIDVTKLSLSGLSFPNASLPMVEIMKSDLSAINFSNAILTSSIFLD